MLKTPAFAAGLCLAALATPAAADPYDDFLQLCVASGGDVAAAKIGHHGNAGAFGQQRRLVELQCIRVCCGRWLVPWR